MVYYSIYESPIGEVFIASTDRGICKITLRSEDADEFFEYIGALGKYSESTSNNAKYIEQLDKYFNGQLKEFNVDMDIKGTRFQLKVWDELTKIPYGKVKTYGDISKALGISCSQAVGQANKRNPLPLIIPCHRVVSASGIGGYGGETAGKSIDVKRYLLSLEQFDCSLFDKRRA